MGRWWAAALLVVLPACGSDAPDGEPYAAVSWATSERASVADLTGTPVLLAGWATWCVPCERELPELDAYAATSPGVVVIAVNVDAPTVDDADIRAMLDRLSVSLPVWRDGDGELLTRFGGALMPFSVLLDRDGEVVRTWSGALDVESDDFREAIAAVAGEPG